MLGAQRRHLGQSLGRDWEWGRERMRTRKGFLEEGPVWSAVVSCAFVPEVLF